MTIRLGVSACLLGKKVRFDGGHKQDRFITDTLGKYVEFVPVCPEVECGLPVPREAMHLEGEIIAPRLVTSRTNVDHTGRMTAWAARRVVELEGEDLCGFIFKASSPSSGMERVRVYDQNHVPSKKGVGLFARAFMEHFPLLPVEDDGRLNDPGLRENFIERIFALRSWRDALASIRGSEGIGALVRFHADHKLLVMAHSVKHLTEMGRLVAVAKHTPQDELAARYQDLFLSALRLQATVRKHVNVLMHMVGYFKKEISSDEKQELLEEIEHYRAGYTPLVVPVTLIAHHVRKYREPYLSRQTYLHPHPLELQLRNHV